MFPALRHTLRSLEKSRGFAVVAILIVGLGIGAGTALFSLVNAILLRSLPVPNPQELRVVHWSGTAVQMRSINGDYSKTAGPREVRDSVNHPTLVQLREQAGVQADIFGFFPLPNIAAIAGETAIASDGLMVSDNFFSGLGVSAIIGRLFMPGDDDAQPHVVISHAIWQQHFGADVGVLGRTVSMQGQTATIIGVLPPGFTGVRPGSAPGFYVPMSANSPYLYVPLTQDWHWFIRLMARVHPGHNNAQLASALTAAFAQRAGDRMGDPKIILEPGQGGLAFDRESYARPLLTMLVVTGLIMLIACANLAGLSLARGASRQHEIAIRAALGATRWQLIRQSLLESTVLAVLGGAFGLLLATWARTAISSLLAGSADGLHYDLSLDGRVLGFSFFAALTTAVATGLLPALRAGKSDPLAGLKSRGAGGTPRLQLGRVLVAAQICVSVPLLVAAGLGLRTLTNLRQINAGFNPGHLVCFDLNPAAAGYNGDTLTAYYDRVETVVAGIPGVSGVTLLDYTLLSSRRSWGGFEFTYQPALPDTERTTDRLTVSESFFATLGISLLGGRGFTPADSVQAPKVIVVNESFVRQYLDGHNPIGHEMTIWGAKWRIVGVCRDAKLQHIKDDIRPTTYFPFRQRFYDRFKNNALRSASFAVRSTLPPAVLRATLDRAVASIDGRIPVMKFTTQNALLDGNLGQERLLATLGGLLAAVALLLCCLGLYGLVAYEVTRRTGEIAIRMAIGAQRRDVSKPILQEALLLTAAGLIVGLPLTLAMTHLIKSQLYGVQSNDPATLIVACLMLTAVALLAAWLPARRAARIDPMVALRAE